MTIALKQVFVKTGNVKNGVTMMDGLKLGIGEGRLGLIFGQAGRGKTRFVQWYAAHNNCVYLRMLSIWKGTETGFLKSFAYELGIRTIPNRKADCFAEILNHLIEYPRPVFLDEIEKLPRLFLELVRDLSDVTANPIVLVGEEELLTCMKRNRRVWSRVWQVVEFQHLQLNDILVYGREVAGIDLSPVADIMYKECQGDFRLLRRNMISLVHAIGDNGKQITPEMAKIACRTGLTGR